MEDCLFCMIAEGKIPSKKLYEDDQAPVVPLSLLRLWAQPLCTIGFLRRIAVLVTVDIRQSLLVCSALPLRGQ